MHPRIFWLEKAKELLNNGVIDRRAHDHVDVVRGQGWKTADLLCLSRLNHRFMSALQIPSDHTHSCTEEKLKEKLNPKKTGKSGWVSWRKLIIRA